MRLKFPGFASAWLEKMSSELSLRICHSSPDKSAFHEAGKTSSKKINISSSVNFFSNNEYWSHFYSNTCGQYQFIVFAQKRHTDARNFQLGSFVVVSVGGVDDCYATTIA